MLGTRPSHWIISMQTSHCNARSRCGIAAQIRARIAFLAAEGKLAPGERLPPVRALAAHDPVMVALLAAGRARRQGLAVGPLF